MEDLQMSPTLIKELKKFEARKITYMTQEGKKELRADEEKKHHTFKYYFQHPNFRLLTVLGLIILNFYMFAEDPVAHSVTDCKISVVGNIFSFVFTNYPPNEYSALKLFLWLFALIFGIVVGKCFIHFYLLCHKLNIKLFSKEGQGSWLVILFFTLCVLYYNSIIYNSFLTVLGGDEVVGLYSTENMHIENKTFMKVVAVLIWSGDILTGWMVLDMMLQEQRYSSWLKPIKKWWLAGLNRVVIFWFITFTVFIVFTVGITTDFMNWDKLSHGFVSTNEIARSFLASVILILDLLVIMQDWDFPHFTGAVELKLPGVPSTDVSVQIPSCCSVYSNYIQYTGKWFYYGLLLIIMVHDMYMWKKQIFYTPFEYGQYTDSEGHIYTVTDKSFLNNVSREMLSYDYRWTPQRVVNSTSNESIIQGVNDLKTLSTYQGYSYKYKALAFIPGLLVIFLFSYITYTFAQDEGEHEKQVRQWYQSKYVKKRKSNKIAPKAVEDSDSESESDEPDILITIQTARKFDYIFQHPVARLLICYVGVFLSWLMIALDPIGHSHAEAKVDVLGNAYSLAFSRYPDKIEYIALKVMMCVGALITSILLGKVLLHNLILNGCFKLKLFTKGQGSWICTFIMLIISLYSWSIAYNRILDDLPELYQYKITNRMDIKFKTFLKGVAVMSFVTHFILTIMVTDTILQDHHYPDWAAKFRKVWQRKYVRICAIWGIVIGVTAAAVTAIAVDFIEWDKMAENLAPADELGRIYLATFIIIFDLLIITQDYEFPRFKLNSHIKLPGFTFSSYTIQFCCIKLELRGKWFIYGLLSLILIIDIYNFKNQMIYNPIDFEQYTYLDDHIRSINNSEAFLHGDTSKLNLFNNYGKHYLKLNAKYAGHEDDVKGTAYLPLVLTILGCITFAISKSNYMLSRTGL